MTQRALTQDQYLKQQAAMGNPTAQLAMAGLQAGKEKFGMSTGATGTRNIGGMNRHSTPSGLKNVDPYFEAVKAQESHYSPRQSEQFSVGAGWSSGGLMNQRLQEQRNQVVLDRNGRRITNPQLPKKPITGEGYVRPMPKKPAPTQPTSSNPVAPPTAAPTPATPPGQRPDYDRARRRRRSLSSLRSV